MRIRSLLCAQAYRGTRVTSSTLLQDCLACKTAAAPRRDTCDHAEEGEAALRGRATAPPARGWAAPGGRAT